MKKILHITNWYPNPWLEHEGVFIREQFRLFSQLTHSKLINVQVRPGDSWMRFQYLKYSDTEEGYYLFTKIGSSRIIELLTTLLLLRVLNKEKVNQYDLLHVHIAYPLLIHFHRWKRWLKIPILVSEHWSAYHFNFYLPKETNKLQGIKRIFRQNLPVITVSDALANDIQKFSGSESFPVYNLPNVIDSQVYYLQEDRMQSEIPVFFMVNVWRSVKNPFPLLEALQQLSIAGYKFRLKIGGYGPLLPEMQGFVSNKGIDDKVRFIGAMDKQAIADTLNRSNAYLFSSTYETFSVACAQALCCGVPLIGPSIPAIREYAGDNDMVVVAQNDMAGWESALLKLMEEKKRFSRQSIAKRAGERFSREALKEKYCYILDNAISRGV